MKANAIDKPEHDKLDVFSYKHVHTTVYVVKNVISYDTNLPLNHIKMRKEL